MATTKELLTEAREYFAQLEKPNEELNVDYNSDYVLFDKMDKENLNKNGRRVLLLDLNNGMKAAFLLIPDMEQNRFTLSKIKETASVRLLSKETKNTVKQFTSHKGFFPNLTLEQQGDMTGAVVKLKDGSYATITEQLEVIK